MTLARSKVTSSDKARLVPWTTLPSMQRLSPSGLMISPQSCATVNLRAPHLAAAAVDLGFGDDRDHGTRTLRVGDPAPHQPIAIAVGVWRRACLPTGALGRRLDHRDVARCLQIAKAERCGVESKRIALRTNLSKDLYLCFR